MIRTTPVRWIAPGTYLQGDEHHYPEERPARATTVAGFWIDRHPVTNAQFEAFVAATGFVTEAERVGGNVFAMASGPVDLGRPELWWKHEPDASWRNPTARRALGPEHFDHPVVQVTHGDALAYAAWAGGRLPTEAEWEWAAGAGGQLGATWPLAPDGMLLANVWLGEFPWNHVRRDPPGTSAVGGFPANPNGLFDMLGNVWELTADPWTLRHDATAAPSPCCAVTGSESVVAKGGSFLCAANYCSRYRPAARHPQPRDEPACHIGIRCAYDSEPGPADG